MREGLRGAKMRLTRWWSRERKLVDVRRPYLCRSSVRPDANDGKRLEEPAQHTKRKGVRRLPRCRKHENECSCHSEPRHRHSLDIASWRR